METFVTYWVGISLAAFFRRGKCWRYNDGNEDARRTHIEMDINAVLLELFILLLLFIAKIKCYNTTTMSIFIIVKES